MAAEGRIEAALRREVLKFVKKKKSQVAAVMNKEITAARKEIVESMMSKSGLKRKTLNDRLSITRANPSNDKLEARLTPLYGKRIYMSEYPFEHTVARGNKQVIRLTSPIYRKNMKTAFLSKDGSRMYLRITGDKTSSVRAVRGRSMLRLYDEFGIRDKYQDTIVERIYKAVRALF